MGRRHLRTAARRRPAGSRRHLAGGSFERADHRAAESREGRRPCCPRCLLSERRDQAVRRATPWSQGRRGSDARRWRWSHCSLCLHGRIVAARRVVPVLASTAQRRLRCNTRGGEVGLRSGRDQRASLRLGRSEAVGRALPEGHPSFQAGKEVRPLEQVTAPQDSFQLKGLCQSASLDVRVSADAVPHEDRASQQGARSFVFITARH